MNEAIKHAAIIAASSLTMRRRLNRETGLVRRSIRNDSITLTNADRKTRAIAIRKNRCGNSLCHPSYWPSGGLGLILVGGDFAITGQVLELKPPSLGSGAIV